MATVVFNVTVTVPDSETATGEERVAQFAKNRGWVETISGEPDEEGNPTTVPNPVTAAEAVASYFNGILQDQMSMDLVNQLNAELNAAREAQLTQIKEAAAQMIDITIGE